MNRRKLWLVGGTVLVLLQAYMLPVMIEALPLLLAVSIFITAVYCSDKVLISSAVLWGLILDVASVNWFGLHIFIALTIAAGMRWLLRKGLRSDSLPGLSLLMVLSLIWYNLVVLMLSGWPVGSGIHISGWLWSLLFQAITTVIFAWLLNKSVKLKVWDRY